MKKNCKNRVILFMTVGLALSCLLFSGAVFAEDGKVTNTLADGTVVVTETVTADDGSVIVTETSYVDGVAVKQVITQTVVVEESVVNDDGTMSTRVTETVNVTTYTPNADGTTNENLSGSVTVTLVSSDGVAEIESTKTLETTNNTLTQSIEVIIAGQHATPPLFPGLQGFDGDDDPDIQDIKTLEDAEAGSPT